MSVIVTDEGFASDNWTGGFAPLLEWTEGGVALDIAPGDDLAAIALVVHAGHGIPGSSRELSAGEAGAAGRAQAPDQVRGAAERVGGPPAMIRVAFPSCADGRGFTLARRLRDWGFRGRLRAAGHVIADQYAMARRAGFDEVEIDAALAARQPEVQWLARADWRRLDYRSRLGIRAG